MSTYDFEPDPDDFGPEPAHIANNLGARRDSRIERGAVSLPTTPDQARKYANGMVPNSTVATMLRSLADQVEAMTAERDAYIVEAARVDTGWRKANEVALETNRKNVALKDAARLALGALTTAHINVLDDMLADEIQQVIAALKAVL